MEFTEHYNFNIEDLIDPILTGNVIKKTVYGYINEDINIRYQTDSKLKEDMSSISFTSLNPLWLNVSDYDIGNVYFESVCIGYAIHNNYDSLVLNTEDKEYYISYDPSGMGFEFESFTNSLISENISNKEKKCLLEVRKKKIDKNRAPSTGIKIDVLLSNTGRLSPNRVERAMKEVRPKAPSITGASEVNDTAYFRAIYDFLKSKPSSENRGHKGYADISSDKKYVSQVYCTCKDFFYRLYAPFVASGLATWNVPSKFKNNQKKNISPAGHNKKWTKQTNPDGKLFLCKHLWAFLAYYITGDVGTRELTDEEIESVIAKYFDIDDEVKEPEKEPTEFKKAFGKLYKRDAKDSSPKIKDTPLKGKRISKSKRDEILAKRKEKPETETEEETEE